MRRGAAPLLLAFAVGGLLASCAQAPLPPAEPRAALGSPQETFETLLRAVREKDLELYKRVFSKRGLREEAMLGRAGRDPERFWGELQGIFRGPQRLLVREGSLAAGRVRAKVEAPQAQRGGIGTITFVKEEDGWKVDRW